MNRLANGNRLSSPGADAGALSVSMKLNSKQKVLAGKMTSIQNSISYLKTQEGAINSAMKIMERIGRIKTQALSPTLTVDEKRSYNAEFIELSDQLHALKEKSFNGVSLFSEVKTGGGLFSAATESFNFSTENGMAASISRHVIDYEDLRYITEAGEAAKRGFGGIDVAYFPSTESQKQVETITIGGNIAHGDEFRFSIKEQTSLLEEESDTPFYFLADAAVEAAADPNQVVRDDFYDQLTGNANIMNFLDVDKVGTTQLRLTSKMKGDPYQLHSYGSTNSTGSISRAQTTANILNDAKEHTSEINLGGASLWAGDTVSMLVNGTPVSYVATPVDQDDHDDWALGLGGSSGTDIMAHGLATAINNEALVNANVGAVGNRKMNTAGQLVYSSGSILLYSKDRGTDFSAGGESMILNAPSGVVGTFSGAETQANVIGGNQVYSVKVGADNTATGAGLIAKGDVYTIRINENRHPDETDNPYTYWTIDPKIGESESHRVTVGAAVTADGIRNQLVAEINANSTLVTAASGASGELLLTSTKPGEGYSVTVSRGTRDSLTKVQDVPNVSPFSIESSMNFLAEMLSQNGAEQSRLNLAHESLGSHYSSGEQAMSRISDVDVAREATRFAKVSLKMNLAEQIMSKSARLKDVLIPLTTNHYRGAMLSATL